MLKNMERKRQYGDEAYESETTSDEEDLPSAVLKNQPLLLKRAQEKFTYEQLIDGIKQGKFKKIVVVTGPGISVSAGVPDFSTVDLGLADPESVFDLNFFLKNPYAFYELARDYLDVDKFHPTVTHHFIRLLQDKGLLWMNIT